MPVYIEITNFTMPLGRELPQLLRQRLFYKGRKFNFEVNRLRLPNNAEGEWECIRHPGGALAVPVTAEGKLILLRQYRFAIQGRIIEFPAGTVEPGEDPLETVQREIQEETGYRAQKWDKLGEFFLAPGYSDEILYAFLARDLEKLEIPPALARDLEKLEIPPAKEEDEDIEILYYTPEELEQAFLEGEPVDAKTVSSFLLARPFLA